MLAQGPWALHQSIFLINGDATREEEEHAEETEHISAERTIQSTSASILEARHAPGRANRKNVSIYLENSSNVVSIFMKEWGEERGGLGREVE